MKKKAISQKEKQTLYKTYSDFLEKIKEKRPETAFKEGAKGKALKAFEKHFNGSFNKAIFEEVWENRPIPMLNCL